MSDRPHLPNRELLLPYLLPYLLYVGVAQLDEVLGREWGYLARIALCGAALAWARPRLGPLRGPRSAWASAVIGLAVGLSATALWVALLAPFVEPGAGAWSEREFGVRLLAAGALAPLAEELLMRGYLLRLLVTWERERRVAIPGAFNRAFHSRSIYALEPGAWTPLAVLGATTVFAAGHAPAEWLAASAYGLVMATLWIVRKDLLSCVVAHAATNLVADGLMTNMEKDEIISAAGESICGHKNK